MENSIPKRRGRPPKNPTAAAAVPAAMKAKAATAAPAATKSKAATKGKAAAAPIATSVPEPRPQPLPPGDRQSGVKIASLPFCFRLKKEDGRQYLSLTDRKGKKIAPDYRQFAGTNREVLRVFNAELARATGLFRWNDRTREADDLCDPSASLIDLSLQCGLLVSDDGSPYQLASGEYRCVLEVDLSGGANIPIIPTLKSESDDISPVAAPPEGFDALHETLLSCGRFLYRVPSLGPLYDRFSFKRVSVKEADLEAWLSLAVSRIATLGISVSGFTTRTVQPVAARAALLFREIDAYGYLHIRPLVHLAGYPPGFFDDQELVQTVKVDREEKQVQIAEVLYPDLPADTFRALLSAAKTGTGKTNNALIHEEAGYFLLEGAFASGFLAENMHALISGFVLLQAPVLEKYKLKIVRPKLKLSLGQGIDYFSGSASVDVAGEEMSFGRFMAQYRKAGCITLSDGSRAWPAKEDIERFDRLVTKTKGSDDAVSVSFFDIPALSRDASVTAEGEGWQKAEDFFRGYNRIDGRTGDYTLSEATLRPYQIYGVKWLEYLRDSDLGACLADEMGLGKTVQVITLLRNSYRDGLKGQTLILVPRSIIYNWKAELARFAPELKVFVHYGVDRDASFVRKTGSSVIISSYATLRNDVEEFAKQTFAYVILDESQNIKNLETRTTGAVLSLKAKHRIALSGTPVENSLGDLYSLFRFLNPTFFGGQTEFLRQYLRPIQERGDKEALHDLRARIYPFMLRRIKRDVLADLPDKIEQTAFIELSAEHQALYDQRRDELKHHIGKAVGKQGLKKSTFLILQALTELRRLAGVPEADGDFAQVSAKREYLREMVGGIVAEGHKCLIFTNFLASVDLVSQDLSDAGIGNLVMTGATSDRQSLVRRFQTDPEISAFIMTVKTGGVGLNLTAADYVFIFDPWWNRAAEAQAIDRTHRIGQKNQVFCYRMIARNTIEEKILELQERKAGLASSLLAADGEAVKSLSEEDIDYLLG